MDKNEIKEKISRCKTLFEKLQEQVYGEATQTETQRQYKEIKDELRTEFHRVNTHRYEKNASKEEIQFYTPFLQDIYADALDVRADAPRKELRNAIYDAIDYCEYWIEEMGFKIND